MSLIITKGDYVTVRFQATTEDPITREKSPVTIQGATIETWFPGEKDLAIQIASGSHTIIDDGTAANQGLYDVLITSTESAKFKAGKKVALYSRITLSSRPVHYWLEVDEIREKFAGDN